MEIKQQARLHVGLATKILKTRDGLLARAYAVWSVARTADSGCFDRDELITFISDRTGRTRETVRKWLNAAIRAGFFVEGKKDRLFLIGKQQVFANLLGDEKPGAVVLVDTDRLLTPSLADLRAAMYGCLFAKKTVWMSRETIHEIAGPVKRTQLRYDAANNQPKQYTYCIDQAGEVCQMPNLYQRAPCFFRPTTKKFNRSKTDESVNGQKTCEQGSRSDSPVGRSFDRVRGNGRNMDLAEKRLLFGSAEDAQKAARRRAKCGLWPVTFSFVEPDHKTRTAQRQGYVFLQSHGVA